MSDLFAFAIVFHFARTHIANTLMTAILAIREYQHVKSIPSEKQKNSIANRIAHRFPVRDVRRLVVSGTQ